MDETHTLATLRTIERNPVRARLVKTAVNYPWSSAKAHFSGADSLGLLDLRAWAGSGAAQEWASLLTREEDTELSGRLLQSLRTAGPSAPTASSAR